MMNFDKWWESYWNPDWQPSLFEVASKSWEAGAYAERKLVNADAERYRYLRQAKLDDKVWSTWMDQDEINHLDSIVDELIKAKRIAESSLKT